MRSLLIALLFICCSCAPVCAQRPAPKSAPATPTTQTDKDKAVAASATLFLEMEKAEAEARLYLLDPEKHKDKAGAVIRLVELYSQLIRNPEALNTRLGLMLSEFMHLREQASNAAQVSQVADEAGVRMRLIEIAQNECIIELLEQLVKKR
jgi:hypothetical protein